MNLDAAEEKSCERKATSPASIGDAAMAGEALEVGAEADFESDGTGAALETVSCEACAKTNGETSGRHDKRRKNRSGRLVIVELQLNAFWRGIAFLSIIRDVSCVRPSS